MFLILMNLIIGRSDPNMAFIALIFNILSVIKAICLRKNNSMIQNSDTSLKARNLTTPKIFKNEATVYDSSLFLTNFLLTTTEKICDEENENKLLLSIFTDQKIFDNLKVILSYIIKNKSVFDERFFSAVYQAFIKNPTSFNDYSENVQRLLADKLLPNPNLIIFFKSLEDLFPVYKELMIELSSNLKTQNLLNPTDIIDNTEVFIYHIEPYFPNLLSDLTNGRYASFKVLNFISTVGDIDENKKICFGSMAIYEILRDESEQKKAFSDELEFEITILFNMLNYAFRCSDYKRFELLFDLLVDIYTNDCFIMIGRKLDYTD